MPKPPPTRLVNAAIRRSAPGSARPATEPRRSASQRRRGPGGATRSPAVRASPLPRRFNRTTTAPAASAAVAVRSVEAPSTTMISTAPSSSRSASIVRPIPSSSLRAATRTVRSSTRCGHRLDGRRHVGRGILDAVVARFATGKKERERHAARERLDVVHARDAFATKGVDGGVGSRRGLDADHGDTGVLQAAHEPVDERVGGTGLRRLSSRLILGRLPRTDDDHTVQRRGRVARALLNERARERPPGRGAVALHEFLAQLIAEITEVVSRRRVVRERLVAIQGAVELGGIERSVEARSRTGLPDPESESVRSTAERTVPSTGPTKRTPTPSPRSRSSIKDG